MLLAASAGSSSAFNVAFLFVGICGVLIGGGGLFAFFKARDDSVIENERQRQSADIVLGDNTIRPRIKGVAERLDNQDVVMAETKADIAAVKTDISAVKSDVGALKTDVSVLQTSINSVALGMSLLQKATRRNGGGSDTVGDIAAETKDLVQTLLDELRKREGGSGSS